MPVYFKFAGSRVPAIDEQWLRRLAESAESSSGLIVTAPNGEVARSIGSVRLG